MNRYEAAEAAHIVERMMSNLVKIVPPVGRAGSEARIAINSVRVNAYALASADELGEPLDDAFVKTWQAGCALADMEDVRRQTQQELPRTLGGSLVKNAGISFCLAIEGRIIGGLAFVSRQDVDALKSAMMQPFAEAEEIAADEMDAMTFQALIGLHAAITNHLVRTALPLPRMVNYKFYDPLPTLVVAYRLYGDAGRADEVRKENKIVHPAFCPPMGQALSA